MGRMDPPKPCFPHFLARNSVGDTQLFWEEENPTPEGAQPQYWRSPVVQKEDHKGTGFGTEISKGTSPRLSEPVWNLYLGCCCTCDLIQKIFWHPITPWCLPTTHLFLAWVSFHHSYQKPCLPTTAFFCFPLFFSLCYVPSPHRGSLDPRVCFFLGGGGDGTRIALLPHDGNCTQSTGIPL